LGRIALNDSKMATLSKGGIEPIQMQ